MRIFHELSAFEADLAGAAVIIGNLDGVHLGHRHLFRMAQATGLVAGAVTFEPHPRRFFMPDSAPFEIGSPADKLEQLAAIGCRFVMVIDFGNLVAGMSAERFMRDVLYGALRVGHVVVGKDFVFGAGRAGDVDLLGREGPALGFATSAIAPKMAGSRICSSSMIRAHISAGRIEDANRALGRPWQVEACVVEDSSPRRSVACARMRERQLMPPDGRFLVDVENSRGVVTRTVASISSGPEGVSVELPDLPFTAAGSPIRIRFHGTGTAAAPLPCPSVAAMQVHHARHRANIPGESL